MSEEQQSNEIAISSEDKERVENAFFAKAAKFLPHGVLISATNLKKEEIDLAITNADIADIYNAINGESPFEESNDGSVLETK